MNLLRKFAYTAYTPLDNGDFAYDARGDSNGDPCGDRGVVAEVPRLDTVPHQDAAADDVRSSGEKPPIPASMAINKQFAYLDIFAGHKVRVGVKLGDDLAARRTQTDASARMPRRTTTSFSTVTMVFSA